MNGSRLSILTFFLATLTYFFVMKPSLTLADSQTEEGYTAYMQRSYTFLIAYLLMVVVSQFLVNASIISSRCGGSFSENMGSAGLFTLLPWSLIFGAMMLMLIMYPGFKTVFGNVAGYYFIARSAKTLFNTMLYDEGFHRRIEGDPDLDPSEKTMASTTAEMVFKVYNDPSLIVNQMAPTNFEEVWNMLLPLVRQEYRDGTKDDVKERLFQLVVTKDNVGEACWYFYTGVLLSLVVALRIQGKTCEVAPDSMEDKYRRFIADQERKEKEKTSASSSDPYIDSTLNP